MTRAAAAVWLGGCELEIRAFDVPEPGPGEVVVAVDLATVCGSDRHTVSGRRSSPSPSILGHEAVGRVVAVGPRPGPTRGGSIAVGDRVVWGVTVSCGTCDRCRSGRSAKCRVVRKVGHEPFSGSWPWSGAYATHVVLPVGSTVVPVPSHVPDAAAALASCAVATVMACFDAAGDISDRRVRVSGIGMLGLVACAVATARRAAAVVACDPDPDRRLLAERFGATRSEAPDTPSAAGELDDVVFELSGAPGAVRSALARTDVGGCIVLAGSVAPAGTVELDPERVVRSLLTVRGVHNYEPHHLEEAVHVLASGLGARLAELVAPPVGLDRIADLLCGAPSTSLRTSVDPRVRHP